MNEVTTIDAIYDLARVCVAIGGKFESKAEAVRRLDEFSIPPSRIATILAMKLNDVTSILAKAKKKKGGVNGEIDNDRLRASVRSAEDN